MRVLFSKTRMGLGRKLSLVNHLGSRALFPKNRLASSGAASNTAPSKNTGAEVPH
jgi:hypothetical protein